jgi:hypothetical protein
MKRCSAICRCASGKGSIKRNCITGTPLYKMYSPRTLLYLLPQSRSWQHFMAEWPFFGMFLEKLFGELHYVFLHIDARERFYTNLICISLV